MNFLLSYIILAEIYAIIAISTNLLVGIVGIFSILQAAVVGLGAYIVAGLTLHGLAGLADRAREFVRNLLYGERKLLSIARVLATGAELLLLDEPASGLSAGALDAVMALLRRLQDEGKSLLVVEHNTRVVQRIADEVLFLHQGHLLAQGPPAAITGDPRLAEIYFGGVI
jgi:ABC-type branched-subunit amino acid transport system ATPase component